MHRDLLRALQQKASRYPHMHVKERQQLLAEVRHFLSIAFDPEAKKRMMIPRATLEDIEPFNLFFFDIETTGLSAKRDRIIEVAITALHSKAKWSCLIDPECVISKQASEITGLTNEMLNEVNAPTFGSIVQELLSFVQEESLTSHATLIAHNVRFDSRFLQAEFDRVGMQFPDNWYFFDSLHFARKILEKDSSKPTSFSLQNLNSHFNLPGPDQEHRALSDVNVLIQVFGSLIGKVTSDQVVKQIHKDRISASSLASGSRPPSTPNRRDHVRQIQLPEQMRSLKHEYDMSQDHVGSKTHLYSSSDSGGENGAELEQTTTSKLHQRHIEFLTTGIPMNDLRDFTALQKHQLISHGFKDLQSLLQHYPRDYLFYSPTAFQDGEFICSQGEVKSIRSFCKGNKGFIQALVETIDDHSEYGKHAVNIKQWLHFRYGAQKALRGITARYPVGSLMAFKGKLKSKSDNNWDLIGNVEMTPLDEFITIEKQIMPVYPAKLELKSTYFNRAMVKAVAAFDKIVEEEEECPELELLPLDVVRRYNLMNYREAIHAIHFPSTSEQAEKARRRLVFEELFLLQTALMLRRHQLQTPKNNVDAKGIKVATSDLLDRALENLPYALTSAQSRVLDEIILDMQGAPPMMRLLQGDVGSGKTIVAMLAMLSVVDSGWQCAFMVPTEILAVQHAQKLAEFLDVLKANDSKFGVPELVVLTGSMKPSQKREVLEGIANGSASIIFGTHALISEGVQFQKLGLAVIDEQHKFGVEQRSKLQSKNQPPPHLLSMSATPIPRTLALTMYGEMALSYIDETPPGRIPIQTSVYKQADAQLRGSAYEKLVSEVQLGNKAFVVFPLIDESESDDFQSIKAAEASFYELTRNELREVSCGLLHGRLQTQEKLEAQDDFITGKTQVLMATAVIEVGVDIPEATVIIVENAERFGLAQLHQLRGRVGRSDRPSYCFLLTGGSDSSHGRIKHMEKLDNGFAVSEMDMAIRGPGEFLGTKQAGQSGLPSLQLTDMKSMEDKQTLEDAREAAARAFSNGEPNLQKSVLLKIKSQPPIPLLDIMPEYLEFE